MNSLTELFCLMNDFCQEFEPTLGWNSGSTKHDHRQFFTTPFSTTF